MRRWLTERAWSAGCLLVLLVGVGLRLTGLGRWSFGPREFDALVDRIIVWKQRGEWSAITRLLDPALLIDRLVFFPDLRLASRQIVPGLELWARLPAAVAGILAIGLLLTWGVRRLGRGAALGGAALVAVSPLLIQYSQFATHHSLAFFASLLCLAAFTELLERGGPLRAGAVAATWVLAVSASPSAYLLLALLGLSGLVWYLRVRDHRIGRWLLATAGLVGIATLVGQLVIGRMGALSWQSTSNLIVAWGQGLAAGDLIAWLRGSLGLTALLIAIAAVPGLLSGQAASRWWIPLGVALGICLLVIGPLAWRVPVEGMPCLLPPILLAAGAGIAQILCWLHRAHPLLSVNFVIVIGLLTAPDWASYYQDGNRYDIREVASRIRSWEERFESNLPPEQRDQNRYAYFCDEPRVLSYYLQRPGLRSQAISIWNVGRGQTAPAPLRGAKHWVVLTNAGRVRLESERPRLVDWIMERFWKQDEVRSDRFDHLSFLVEVFRGVRPPIKSRTPR